MSSPDSSLLASNRYKVPVLFLELDPHKQSSQQPILVALPYQGHREWSQVSDTLVSLSIPEPSFHTAQVMLLWSLLIMIFFRKVLNRREMTKII